MRTNQDKLRRLLYRMPPDYAHEGDAEDAAAASMAVHLAAADPHTQYLTASEVVLVPVGGIIGWSGTLASCPANWAVCNGVDNAPGPDLTAQFIV